MSSDATPSYFPSVTPTFGWRRVVELADEFKVTSADMLKICDRLGVTVADASEWLDADTVDRMRDVIKLQGPGALLKPPVVVVAPKEKPAKLKREKPVPEPKPAPAPKLKVEKPAKVHEPAAAVAATPKPAPELGSVSRDGVRTRPVLAIALAIAVLAVVIGVLVQRWVQDVTNTDAPATAVTIVEQ